MHHVSSPLRARLIFISVLIQALSMAAGETPTGAQTAILRYGINAFWTDPAGNDVLKYLKKNHPCHDADRDHLIDLLNQDKVVFEIMVVLQNPEAIHSSVRGWGPRTMFQLTDPKTPPDDDWKEAMRTEVS